MIFFFFFVIFLSNFKLQIDSGVCVCVNWLIQSDKSHATTRAWMTRRILPLNDWFGPPLCEIELWSTINIDSRRARMKHKSRHLLFFCVSRRRDAQQSERFVNSAAFPEHKTLFVPSSTSFSNKKLKLSVLENDLFGPSQTVTNKPGATLSFVIIIIIIMQGFERTGIVITRSTANKSAGRRISSSCSLSVFFSSFHGNGGRQFECRGHALDSVTRVAPEETSQKLSIARSLAARRVAPLLLLLLLRPFERTDDDVDSGDHNGVWAGGSWSVLLYDHKQGDTGRKRKMMKRTGHVRQWKRKSGRMKADWHLKTRFVATICGCKRPPTITTIIGHHHRWPDRTWSLWTNQIALNAIIPTFTLFVSRIAQF